MLKTLLNKQMTEIFRSYFYDQKKGKKRSAAGTAAFIVMYALIMVGILGGIFTYLSVALCAPFTSAGMGWLYFTIMSLIAIALGAFGSVFNTFSGLYLAKDNDLLFSMPIPVDYIIASRLLGVYLMGLMYSAVVIIPAVVVYIIKNGISAANLIGGILLTLNISLIVLVLSCILGWVVAKLSQKLKNKSFITVVISLVFIAAYYFVYFKAQSVINELIENVAVYGSKFKASAYPLYVFGRSGEGDALSLLVVTAAVALLCVLTWLVLKNTFIGIATTSVASSHTAYKEKKTKRKSVRGAMFSKEMARFTSSPNYMLNCGLGSLGYLIILVLMLIKGKVVLGALSEFFESKELVFYLMIAALSMISAMNDITSPSVSLEGKSIWIAQSLPVKPEDALRAKICMHVAITAVPAIIASVGCALVLGMDIMYSIFSLVIPLAFIVFYAELGLTIDLKRPNLAWTSEIIPIKQSLGVMISLLGGWVISAVLFGVYLMLPENVIPIGVYLVLVLAVMLIIDVLLAVWIKKKGSRIFASL